LLCKLAMIKWVKAYQEPRVLFIRFWVRCRFEMWGSLNEFFFFFSWVEFLFHSSIWKNLVTLERFGGRKVALLAWCCSIFPPVHMVYTISLFWIDCLVESINSSRFILRAPRQLSLLCFWSLFVCEIHFLVLVFLSGLLFLFVLALCSFIGSLIKYLKFIPLFISRCYVLFVIFLL